MSHAHSHPNPTTHPVHQACIHTHNHTHTPTINQANERKVLVSFGFIFVFMLVEVAGGVWSGSLALLADAGHMLNDAGALALAYAAFRLGRRGADSKRTFGYLRLEVLAGLVNALTLFAIVVWIAVEAWQRLSTPGDILARPMLAVAVVGLLVNAVVLWIMTRGDTEHVNVRGAMLHVMGDLLGSVGAVIAAIVINVTGWKPIDPILSLIVALLIVRSAWALLRESLHILLEGAPEHATPEQLERTLMAAVAGLAAVRHVHVWQLTSGRTMATLHVRADQDEHASAVVKQVECLLREQFDIDHATIAIDWNADGQTQACPAGCRAKYSNGTPAINTANPSQAPAPA